MCTLHTGLDFKACTWFGVFHPIFPKMADIQAALLRSVDLWIKGCVKCHAFLLRRRACFPSPFARVHALFYLQIPPAQYSGKFQKPASLLDQLSTGGLQGLKSAMQIFTCGSRTNSLFTPNIMANNAVQNDPLRLNWKCFPRPLRSVRIAQPWPCPRTGIWSTGHYFDLVHPMSSNELSPER